MTRDTSLCLITGTGPVECEAQIRALTPSEKMCSSSGALTKSAGESVGECGDETCDEGEEESCPEDCPLPSSGFPWLWILIAVIVIGAATTGIILYKKKKKAVVAGIAKPGEKKEDMPFAAQKDLDSVLGYIRAAKGKGYKDEQIVDALKKAGWKEEQIKYAFNKINNPQQAAKPAVTSTQAAVKPVQQAAQPVKK